MLKHITVPIIVDDHEPTDCGDTCRFRDDINYICILFNTVFTEDYLERCKQCLDEAK